MFACNINKYIQNQRMDMAAFSGKDKADFFFLLSLKNVQQLLNGLLKTRKRERKRYLKKYLIIQVTTWQQISK